MKIGTTKIDSDGSTVKVAKDPTTGAVALWLYQNGKSPVVVDMRPVESEHLEKLLHIANS